MIEKIPMSSPVNKWKSGRAPCGFTLVELMIVVAIVGILARISIPAYKDYVRRSQTAEMVSTLPGLRLSMEQFYQDNKNYGVSTCGTGLFTLAPANTQYFTYTCVLGGTAQSYTITAAAKSTSAASGYSYTLTDGNVRGTTYIASVASTKACWIVRGDEC